MNKKMIIGILINMLILMFSISLLKVMNEYNSMSYLFGVLSSSIYGLIVAKFIYKN